MEVLIAIAGKAAEYSVAPIGRSLGYSLFYKSNVKNLETQVKKLQNIRERVQHDINTATWDAQEIEPDVSDWINKVDEMIGKVNAFYEDDKVSCLNLLRRGRLSKTAKKMTLEVTEIQAEGNFSRVGYYLPPQGMRPSQPAKDYKALESRTNTAKKIMETLKDPSIHTIGLWGSSGVGKTTLAKEVERQAKELNLFDSVVMTTITDKPDVEKVQGRIADLLGLSLHANTAVGRADRLRERIKKEKRILVIVDDIWADFDLSPFGIPLGDEHKGCKLLLTSRSSDVLNCEMGIQKGFELEVLQQDEAMSLFEETAGDVTIDPTVHPTATEIVRRCAGLPVLIVPVAKALRNKKELYAWKDALKQLEKFDKDGMHRNVYSALELSYSHLKSAEHKAMFLLIGFLGRSRINKYSLFIYMWSGLFRNLDTLEDARNRLNMLTSDLKASSLLLEDGEEWIAMHMHDTVKEVAASIAKTELGILRFDERKGWPQMDVINKCRLIYLPPSNINSLPERLEAPELQVFILEQQTEDMQVPDNLFENTRDLKVLDLVYLKFTPKLPVSLSYLKNLRALSFYVCKLEDITIVGELKNLQMLSLIGSTIRQLPREIEQLHRLLFLNLDDCVYLKVIPAKVLSNLTLLEELQMRNTNIDWKVEGQGSENTNASLNELKELQHLKCVDLNIPHAEVWPMDLFFEKLDRFRILIGQEWGLDCATDSKTLKLKHNRSIQNEHGIKILVKNVDNLYLDELNGVENVVCDLNSNGFPLLKFLMVRNNAEIKCIVMSLSDPLRALPNLESSSLSNLSSLEHICHWPLTRESFSKLKSVEIKYCEKLVIIFPASIARNLRNLETLMVDSCSSVELIFELEDPNDIREYSGMSTQFRCLSLVRLPKLKHVWSNTDLQGIFNLRNLGSLFVKACPNLNYVFPVSEARNLAKLKDLLIEDSPTTALVG